MDKYLIALDVGGTTLNAGLITEEGEVFMDTYSVYQSKAKEQKKIILENFCKIIEDLILKIDEKDFIIRGIGMGFPGPFDYERGISYINGIDKFDSLYGVNIAEELRYKITNNMRISSKFIPDFPIVFENDVNLFALGEYYIRKTSNYKRSIYISIGTGTNSAFLIDGALIKEMMNIPRNGYIYNMPYKDGIADNYISRRGILKLAEEMGFDINTMDVKELSILAQNGDKNAIYVFERFGSMLGEVLLPHIEQFKPEVIILGGQISKSYALFIESMEKQLQNNKVVIEISKDSVYSTLVGATCLI